MPLRVIAGIAKGRRLKLVPGDTTRPIMDKVKEALFSILGRSVIDASFLDLYAGTGSVGIEALSRGAKQAFFVEREKAAVQTIQSNLEITGFVDKAIVRRGDVLAFLARPPQQTGLYDFIYIAPPQYKSLWLDTIKAIDSHPAWVDDETSIIIQIDPSEYQDITFDNLEEYDRRIYGKTMVWFLRKKLPESEDESTREDEPTETT
ncbi:MAG: 16S rRNA (guanine(966)-N(2))-methyltransferase RsmD [Chitinophagaceae bacterium]|nr:16S rRNA (guanine(966)-N(2))-methyltransferase RsmD [Anaerolineae bacterium]